MGTVGGSLDLGPELSETPERECCSEHRSVHDCGCDVTVSLVPLLSPLCSDKLQLEIANSNNPLTPKFLLVRVFRHSNRNKWAESEHI